MVRFSAVPIQVVSEAQKTLQIGPATQFIVAVHGRNRNEIEGWEILPRLCGRPMRWFAR